MKRVAAIIGPTPPFIRWALPASCPLVREGGTAARNRNPAQSAWRQLRGLKEISRAVAEGRSLAGYCFATESTAEHVLAVKIDEVTTPLGGSQRVAQACRECPANPTPALDRWAACTGLLPLVTPAATVELTNAAWLSLRDAIERRAIAAGVQLPSGAGWTRTWTGPFLPLTAIASARALLNQAVDLFARQTWECTELLAALEHAEHQEQGLWLETIPTGWSDGQTWSLPDYCLACGGVWLGSGSSPCSNCGRSGTYQAARRLKVLGLRPYLQLSQVLGQAAAQQLQLEYEAARSLSRA